MPFLPHRRPPLPPRPHLRHPRRPAAKKEAKPKRAAPRIPKRHPPRAHNAPATSTRKAKRKRRPPAIKKQNRKPRPKRRRYNFQKAPYGAFFVLGDPAEAGSFLFAGGRFDTNALARCRSGCAPFVSPKTKKRNHEKNNVCMRRPFRLIGGDVL